MKRQDELKENIKSLEEDLRKLVDFRGKMETSVEEFKSFEDTISQLVEESEHISTTKDFMDKCDALSESQKLQFTLKCKTPLSLFQCSRKWRFLKWKRKRCMKLDKSRNNSSN